MVCGKAFSTDSDNPEELLKWFRDGPESGFFSRKPQIIGIIDASRKSNDYFINTSNVCVVEISDIKEPSAII